MGVRRGASAGKAGRRRRRRPARRRALLRRLRRLLAPGLALVGAVIVAWLLVGAPDRSRPASRAAFVLPVPAAGPAGAVSLTASPRLTLPGSRLAEAKLAFGVDLEALAKVLGPSMPVPSSRPIPVPATIPTPPSLSAAFSPVALPLPPPRRRSRDAAAPALAVMIDDLGHDPQAARRAIDLPGRLTLAFLPYGHAIPELTAAAVARGHDVFLHLPMEPEGPDDPGPNALLIALDPAELARRLAWAFEQVPGAVGVNNHMGSRATRDPDLMLPVLREIHRRGLAFVDSRTSPLSVANALAGQLGLAHAARDVFLDNDPAPVAIRARLDEAEQFARRDGTALAIGHPYPSTLAVLAEWLPGARMRGIELVTARELIAREGCAGVVAAAAGRGCPLDP